MAEKFERTKLYFFVILFLIVGAGFIYAVSINIFKTTVNAATTGVLSDEYEVDFVAGVTLERVIDFTIKTNAQLISLEHSIQIGDEIFSGGYFVRAANNSKKAILNDYRSSHLSFLHDALNTRSQSPLGLSMDAQNARDHYFEAIKNEIIKGDSFQRISIKKLLFEEIREFGQSFLSSLC